MSPQLSVANDEVAILSRLIEPDKPTFSKEAARSLLALDFTPEDRERMHYLAQKAQVGTLTPAEKEEIDNYEHVGHLLSLLKSKARKSLKRSARRNS